MTSIGILLGILLLLFIILQVRWLFSGPGMRIQQPDNGQLTNNPIMTVIGHAPRAINARVNGVATPVDTKGYFALDVLLYPGINSISITTENRYKRFTTTTRTVVLKPTPRAESETLDTASPETPDVAVTDSANSVETVQ